MGLFGKMFGGKNEEKQPQAPKTNLKRELSEAVAACMTEMGIIREPMLYSFEQDWGLCDNVIVSHLIDVDIRAFREQYGDRPYLRLMGCPAMGAGGYVAACQRKFQKPVGQFGEFELTQIQRDFENNDLYELFLHDMRFGPDSMEKKCLDHIASVWADKALALIAPETCSDENAATLMRVMYDAGITVVMR